MNESQEGRNQADRLVRGFKRSGLVAPVMEFQPKPTGGDAAREIIGELTESRDATVASADEQATRLWEVTNGR